MSACVGACCGTCFATTCANACRGRGDASERKDDATRDVEGGGGANATSEGATRVNWRARYAMGFIAIAFATWVMRDAGGASKMGDAFGWTCADEAATGRRSCKHEVAVRVGLGNAFFFALMFICTFGIREDERASVRTRLNDSYWLAKTLAWVGLVCAAFAVPLDDYGGLVNANRFFASIFLLVQIIVLLGWVYDLNDKLMKRMEDESSSTSSSSSLAMLLASALVSYGGAFTLLGFMYKYWAPSSGCSRNIALITCMFIFCVIFTVISLHGRVNGGLFTSGCMTLYCFYALASALASEPKNYTCAPSTSGDLDSVLAVISFFFGLCALGVTVQSSSSTSAFAGDFNTEDPTSRYTVSFFHFVFFTASSYCAMLFVDWTNGKNPHGAGWESAWAKVSCAYFSAFLYTWALIAPLVLHNRDF